MVALALACAWAAPAASIDGKWGFESKQTGGKKDGAAEVTIKTTLDLKSAGDKLTGKVTMAGGPRERTAEIKDGKIDGNTISFVTEIEGKKGVSKTTWKATLAGDELKGTQEREGAKQPRPFAAKRQ